MEKESMVIYKSIISAIDLLPDAEQKWEAIKGITDFGFYDKKPESENPIINMIYIQAIPSLRGAKDRYEKAVEDGKKGGRPAEVSTEKIIQMKNEGMTNKQIADAMGCTVKNIENRITSYKKNNPNNPNNPPRTTPITPTKNDDIHPNNPNNPPITPLVFGDPNNPNNLSVYVSEYVSEYEYDDVDVYVASPDSSASPGNATDVAQQQQQQQQQTLSNLIKYKIREMWKPGVKQNDVIKNIKSEFGIDLTFADVNEIWDKYKSSTEKEKLKELADKEESDLRDQQKQDKALQRKLTHLDDLMSALDNRGVMATDDEVIAKCKEFYYSNRPDKYKWSCKDLIEIVNNSHSKINDTFDSVLKEFVEIKNNYV
jgi:uncharacterized protein (DUF433 family)